MPTPLATPSDLRLQEAVLLLSLHDEKGTTGGNTSYAHAVGGAVLSELLLAGRIELVRPKRTHLVQVVDSAPVGEPLLDECLEKIVLSKRPKSATAWISGFAGISRLKHRVADGLCDRGVLRKEKRKVLFVFTRWTYPTADPGPKRALVDRMRRIVEDGEVPDPHSLVILSLAHGTGLLKRTLGKHIVRGRKDWINRLIEGDAVGAATRQALEAAQAAAVVTTIAMPR